MVYLMAIKEQLNPMSMSVLPGQALMAIGALSVVGVSSLVAPTPVTAATLTLNAIEQGWWSPTVVNTIPNNMNYITGQTLGVQFHSFFTFQVPVLPSDFMVASAVLELRRAVGAGNATQTLGLFDVATAAATLAQQPNNANDPLLSVVYQDLGSGISYGTFSVSVSPTDDQTEILQFSLNQNALAAIQSSQSSFFSIGTALLGLPPTGEQYLFGFSGLGSAIDGAKLTLSTPVVPSPPPAPPPPAQAIPEPGVLPGIVLSGMGLRFWRKRRAGR